MVHEIPQGPGRQALQQHLMRIERTSQSVPEHADTAEEIGYSLQVRFVGSRLAFYLSCHSTPRHVSFKI